MRISTPFEKSIEQKSLPENMVGMNKRSFHFHPVAHFSDLRKIIFNEQKK